MSSAVRVLHLDSAREWRGGQRQTALLLEGLAAAGFECGLAAPPDAALWKAVESIRALERHAIPFQGELSWNAFRQLRSLIERSNYDLVHAHTAHAVTPGYWAARGRNLPLIAHRRVEFPLRRHPLARWKSSWPAAWIAVAPGVAQRLRQDGVDPRRVFVVESAIDPRRLKVSRSRAEVRDELGIPPEALALITVGELAAHKGQHLLLDALASLSGLCLLLVGEGSERPALEQQVRDLDLGSRVRVLGQRSDVADLMMASDLFVFPSISGEGSPAAIKEAMWLGLPILASAIPAHRDLELAACELFEPSNREALRQAIASWLRTPQQLATRIELNREKASRFTPQRLAQETLEVYRQVRELARTPG
jgi:glycosyltransferase involved in cell wall biosynthesis